MSYFFCEKGGGTCGRKEKQDNKIGQNLSLRRRRRETISARRKSLLDLKDNSPERLKVDIFLVHIYVSNFYS